MMMHFLKLYIFFHKYVYHLEFIKVFLNQYGKGKCISEIKKIRSQAGRKLFNESRGEIFNLDACVADARNVQNRIITHARAFKFDDTSSLAL